MADVLVAGGTGYVGGEVVRQSLTKGDKVCVLGRTAAAEKKIDAVQCDITDAKSPQKALSGRRFDIIYHVASLPGDTGNPYEMMNVNVMGLMNMLEWARANPVKRYVVSSSISALEWYPATRFCPPKYMPVDEEHPDNPRDMYSTTKRMQELLAMTYYHQFGVPTTILRLTAVVGPAGKGGGRGYLEMARMLKEGKKVQIPHFSAEELCHYVDIRDAARMHLAVGEHPRAVGEIFNCCAKEPTRGSNFIKIVKELVPGIEVECGFAWSMAQGGEICFSMEKAKRMLGFEPKYTLEDAIRSIKEWVDAGGLEESVAQTKQRYGTGVISNLFVRHKAPLRIKEMKYIVANVDPQLHPSSQHISQILAEADAEVIEKECVTEQDVIEFARNADGIIATRACITKTVIDNLAKCKVIGRPGTGTDNIDHEAATNKGMVVVYVPDFCTEEVSNHALMFLLACHAKLMMRDREIRTGNLHFDGLVTSPSIRNQTLGLIGFGRIGQRFAEKAQLFGIRVLANDPYIKSQTFSKYKVQQAALEEILKDSDYVSLHLPLTEETRNLIGREEIEKMKPSAYLINCARGPLVDETALIDALRRKIIAGAALDCLTVEPPSRDNPLLGLDNVILTPHIAASSDDAIRYLRKKTAEQVSQVLEGKKPEFIRNPEVLNKISLAEAE